MDARLNVRDSPIVHHAHPAILPAQRDLACERFRVEKTLPLPVELRRILKRNDVGNPQLQQFFCVVTQEFECSIVRVDVLCVVVRDEDGIQGLFEDCSPVGQKDLPLAGGI